MADPTVSPELTLQGADTAPFVYFDNVPTFGTLSGTIQLELAARIIVPGTTTRAEFVCTGHLRCSPAAALSLRQAIDGALRMLPESAAEKPAAPPPIVN